MGPPFDLAYQQAYPQMWSALSDLWIDDHSGVFDRRLVGRRGASRMKNSLSSL